MKIVVKSASATSTSPTTKTLFFVIINNYSERISFVGERFHTLIGAIFLVIVLVSPGGLIGLWERFIDLLSGRRRGPVDRLPLEVGRAEPTAEGGLPARG